MPTYQYKCPKCGHEFEEFQKMSDPPIEICPNCKGQTHRIVTGGIGFVFKGSGFYITDNRSKSYNESRQKERNDSPLPKSTDSKK